MSWNDGYERKKFERKQVGQAKWFRDLGMTDEQIQEIYASDLREYRDNRIFSIHTQSIDSLENDESRNGLYKKFVTSTTCSMDMSECSRFEWIEEIENSVLYLAISKLAVQQKELLTLLYRLQRYADNNSLRDAINICIEKARKCRNEVWEGNLCLLLHKH